MLAGFFRVRKAQSFSDQTTPLDIVEIQPIDSSPHDILMVIALQSVRRTGVHFEVQ
jgi:hypothetical protein